MTKAPQWKKMTLIGGWVEVPYTQVPYDRRLRQHRQTMAPALEEMNDFPPQRQFFLFDPFSTFPHIFTVTTTRIG